MQTQQLAVRRDPLAAVERFRVETWAMLHAWVNGLTLLSTIARARAQSSSRAV